MQMIKLDSRMAASDSGMTDLDTSMPGCLPLRHVASERLPYAVPKMDVLTFGLASEDIIYTSPIEVVGNAVLIRGDGSVESITQGQS